MSSLLTGIFKQLRIIAPGLLILFLLTGNSKAQSAPVKERPRIVITADPELDDNNSLIRFLLYSSDLEIEGLIYASSGFHWKGDGKGTKWFVPGREYSRFGLDTCPCVSWRWAKDERFIHNAVETYAKVYPNLKIHNAEYPDPKILLSKIRYGNIEFDGDISKDTPGSDLIKSLMLDDKPGHLFITAWGGHSTIARALKSIKDQYEFTEEWDNIRNKVSQKVILLPSGDQDDTYAKYIKPNWPDLFPAAQRDFAARLKWSVTPKYTDANHAPAVTVQGPLEIVASSGETIRLNANVTDHDGNKIAIRWWQLHVGSYKGNAAITDENSARAKVFIPKDAVPGQTLHIIVETTDDGVPSMTAYQR